MFCFFLGLVWFQNHADVGEELHVMILADGTVLAESIEVCELLELGLKRWFDENVVQNN